MATRRGYVLKDGTRPISVTETLKFMGGSTEGLVRWAYERGKAGESLYDERRKALDIGTLTHALIESDGAVDLEGVDPKVASAARDAYERFREWREIVGLEIVEREVQLVCEDLRVGGTVDTIALVGGVRVLIDWKTSKGIYPEHVAQLGAYALLWRNVRGEAIEHAGVLRLAKEPDDPIPFEYVPISGEVLEHAKSCFLAALSIARSAKVLRGALVVRRE